MQAQLAEAKQIQKQQEELNKKIQKELASQQSIRRQIQQSADPSVVARQCAVEDVTEAIGDILSAALSAMGKVASAGVSAVGNTASTLLVQPLKAIGKMTKSATSETVASSDVFPSVSTHQVFPSSNPNQSRLSQLSSSRVLSQANLIPSQYQPTQQYGTPLMSQQSNIETVNAPSVYKPAQSLASPARASFNPSRLRTSRLDFTSGDESDSYSTATESPLRPCSRLSSRILIPSGYESDIGYTTASESVNPSGLIIAPDNYSNVPSYLVFNSARAVSRADTCTPTGFKNLVLRRTSKSGTGTNTTNRTTTINWSLRVS